MTTVEYYYEEYLVYEDDWHRENPPFAGPYQGSPLMTYDEFVTKLCTDLTFANQYLLT